MRAATASGDPMDRDSIGLQYSSTSSPTTCADIRCGGAYGCTATGDSIPRLRTSAKLRGCRELPRGLTGVHHMVAQRARGVVDAGPRPRLARSPSDHRRPNCLTAPARPGSAGAVTDDAHGRLAPTLATLRELRPSRRTHRRPRLPGSRRHPVHAGPGALHCLERALRESTTRSASRRRAPGSIRTGAMMRALTSWASQTRCSARVSRDGPRRARRERVARRRQRRHASSRRARSGGSSRWRRSGACASLRRAARASVTGRASRTSPPQVTARAKPGLRDRAHAPSPSRRCSSGRRSSSPAAPSCSPRASRATRMARWSLRPHGGRYAGAWRNAEGVVVSNGRAWTADERPHCAALRATRRSRGSPSASAAPRPRRFSAAAGPWPLRTVASGAGPRARIGRSHLVG